MKNLITLLFLLMTIGSITAQIGSTSPYGYFDGFEYVNVQKIDGKTVRFRTEKIKSEIHYFKDDFNGVTFTNSVTPFYKQTKNEDSKNLKRIGVYKNSIIIEFYSKRKKKNSTVMLLDEMEVLFFDVQNLNQLGSTSLKIPQGAEIPLSRLIELTLDNYQFTLMPFYDPELKKKYVKIVYLENLEFKNINVENTKTANQTDALSLLKVEDTYLLYFINKNELEWSSSICSLNLENQTYELIDEKVISDDQIFKENKSAKNNKKRYFSYRFESTTYIKDESSYIISLGKFDSTEKGTMIGDMIVSKIENGKIVWNQFIKSSLIYPAMHNQNFNISNDEEYLIIDDMEPKGLVNENGEFNDSPLLAVNFINVKIKINLKTGEFKRELIENK